MSSAAISGVWTALITPMRNGAVDDDAFKRLIDAQIAGGVSGIVISGTTGEAASLNADERLQLMSMAVRHANGRIGVMGGTSASGTQETCDFTARAVQTGISHVLVATPAYNKPTQAGLVEHFKAVSDAAGKAEVMLYNVPGRTACNMLPETVAKIGEACANVTSVKEASGDLVQMANVRRLSQTVTLMSGDDGVLLPVLSLGGRGVVSVISNAVPALVVAVVKAWEAGDREGAANAQLRLLPLIRIAFSESNPIPVKWAMKLLGFGDGGARLPMTTATEATQQAMEAELKSLGVL